MTCAVLSIGTELTRGELVDTNASWLAQRMTDLGLEVVTIETVGDEAERIVQALHRLAAQHDALVCTGGLGPTSDDVTRQCVAAVLQVPLQRDEATLQTIRRRMERFGRSTAPSNEKQADVPEGARILPNDFGTAPGFAVSMHGARAFFLPGVPREMQTLFDEQVAPWLQTLVRESSRQIRIKTFGLPESTVNDRLAGLEAQHSVRLAYRAHFPQIEVKVLARDPDARRAQQRARRAADAVEERLGNEVAYGEGDTTLAQAVGQQLVHRGWRLGVAESCTGGLLATLLTERSGSSAYFAGGIISYANEVKQTLLGVAPEVLDEHGAVSEAVARAMAEGARERLNVEVAVSVTGVAGPTGATADKPVGLVHYAVATPEQTVARQLVYPGARWQVQRISAFAALHLVRTLLLSEP